jgi:hypothetical protein
MSDITTDEHGRTEEGASGISDDDLNAELDADMAEALAADHDAEDDAAEQVEEAERDAGAGI